MKRSFGLGVESCRISDGPYGSQTDNRFGMFIIPGPEGVVLKAIVCSREYHRDTHGWDHVSVSTNDRCPTWKEMSFIKDLFWDQDECVMQLHPPKSEYINNHPYVLHLWKPPYKLTLPPKNQV